MRELLTLSFLAFLLHCSWEVAPPSNPCHSLSGTVTFDQIKKCQQIKGTHHVTVTIGQVDETEWNSFAALLEELYRVEFRIENSTIKKAFFSNLRSIPRPTCTLVIVNNPDLEEFFISAQGPDLTSFSVFHFNNNPRLKSVRATTGKTSKFTVEGDSLIIENNIALEIIEFPDSTAIDVNQLYIKGNPLLKQVSIDYFKKLKKEISKKYIQDEGECVFAEEISDLGKLASCKYVKGDLNLAADVTGSAGSAVLSRVDGKAFLKDPKMDQLGFLKGVTVNKTECQFSQEVTNLDVLTLCSEVKGDLTLVSGVKGSTGSHLLEKVDGNVNLKDAKENQLGFLKGTTVTGQTTGSCLTSLHGNPVKKEGICPAGSATTTGPKNPSKSNSTLTKPANEGAGFFTQNLVPISVGAAVVTLLVLVATGIFIYCRFFKKKKNSKVDKGIKKKPAVVQAVKAPVVKKPEMYKKPMKKEEKPKKRKVELVDRVEPMELPKIDRVYDIAYTDLVSEFWKEQRQRLGRLVDEILTFNPLEFMEVVGPLKYTYYLPNGKDTRGKPMKKEYDDLLAKYRNWQPGIPIVPVPEPNYDDAEGYYHWQYETQVLYDTILGQKGDKKIALCLWSHDNLVSAYPMLRSCLKPEMDEERAKCEKEREVELEERQIRFKKLTKKREEELDAQIAKEKEEKRKKREKEEREMDEKKKEEREKEERKEEERKEEERKEEEKKEEERKEAGRGATSKTTSMTKSREEVSGEQPSATAATVSGEKPSTEATKPPPPKYEGYFTVDQCKVYMAYFGKKYEPNLGSLPKWFIDDRRKRDEGMVTVFPFHLMKGHLKEGEEDTSLKHKPVELILRKHNWTFEQLSFVVASAWPMRALGEDKHLTFRAIRWAYRQMEEHVYMLVEAEEHKEECAMIAQLILDSVFNPAMPPITFLGACRLITARKKKSWDNPNMLLFLQRNILSWFIDNVLEDPHRDVEDGYDRIDDCPYYKPGAYSGADLAKRKRQIINWNQIYDCMMLRSRATPATRVYKPDDLPCPRNKWPRGKNGKNEGPPYWSYNDFEHEQIGMYDDNPEIKGPPGKEHVAPLLRTYHRPMQEYEQKFDDNVELYEEDRRFLYDPMQRTKIRDDRKWGIWSCDTLGRAVPEPLTAAGRLWAKERLGKPQTELLEPTTFVDRPIGFKIAWGEECIEDGGPDDESTNSLDEEELKRWGKNNGPELWEQEQLDIESEAVLGLSANAKMNRRWIFRLPEEVYCSDGLNENEARGKLKKQKKITRTYAKEYKGFRLPSDMDHFLHTGPLIFCQYSRPLKRAVKLAKMDEGRFEDMDKMVLKGQKSKKDDDNEDGKEKEKKKQ